MDAPVGHRSGRDEWALGWVCEWDHERLRQKKTRGPKSHRLTTKVVRMK